MLAKERQSIILDILRTKNIIKISDIVKQFDVSNETARRDLEALQDQKLIKRIYGGAVLTELPPQETQYASRSGLGHAEKRAIGKAAAALVNEGETILIDTGTTMLEIARNLKHMNNLTVVTNSLPVINELANSNVCVFVLGGQLNPDELCMVGGITIDAMKNFFVDKAFMGAGGVTFTGGITDYSADVYCRRFIVERANKVILVADSNKFGYNAFSFVCAFDQVDMVISDSCLSKEYINGIRDRKMELQLIDPEETVFYE